MTNLRIAIEEITDALNDHGVEVHIDLLLYGTSEEPPDNVQEKLDKVNAILSKHRAGSLDVEDMQDATNGEVDGGGYEEGDYFVRVAIDLA